MKRFILFICAFISLVVNAQNVSQSEAFQKAQKFMGDKKLKAPATTRGEDAVKPYYIFNAEDGNGSIIVSGDKRLPDILAYSKEKSIEGDSIPDDLKELIPLTSELIVKTWYGSNDTIPDIYVPRNTTRVERIMPNSNDWNQDYPYNMKCPYMPGEYTDWLRNRAPVGCVPISAAQIMNFYKYPKHVNSFETTYSIIRPTETSKDTTIVNEIVPATDFKFDLIEGRTYHYGNFSDETLDALSELCFHVGRALGAIYGKGATGVYMYKVMERMKNVYGYEAEEIKCLGYASDTSNGEYLPDEDYWNFLDSHLEKGIPILASGARHAYVIDGRDENGLYYYHPFYIIIQPSLYAKYGYMEKTIMNKNIHLIAFYPPGYTYTGTGYTPTDIKSVDNGNTNDGIVYNLQGNKVGNTLEGLPNGVYIKDGKKYIVK